MHLIQEKLEAITELCRRYHVAQLEVFGSAADDSLDSENSDVDFLVEFQPGQDLARFIHERSPRRTQSTPRKEVTTESKHSLINSVSVLPSLPFPVRRTAEKALAVLCELCVLGGE